MATLTTINDPRSFWEEARSQLVCASCKRRTDRWEAHHALQKQRCRRAGAPQHSPDNALRLCAKAPDACHERHTTFQERIPLACLRDENIAFAAFWLGAGGGYEYLTVHYAGPDPRVDALLVG
jgi:hypothetical protein